MTKICYATVMESNVAVPDDTPLRVASTAEAATFIPAGEFSQSSIFPQITDHTEDIGAFRLFS